MPFSAGLIAGGVVSSAAWWAATGAIDLPREPGVLGAFAAVAGLLFLRDIGVLELPLPEARRQIARHVLRKGATGYVQFGFAMGTGVRTYVTAAAPYSLLLGLLLVSPPGPIFLSSGVGFGLGRALTPLLRYLSPNGAGWDRAMDRAKPIVVPVAGAATSLVTVGLLYR